MTIVHVRTAPGFRVLAVVLGIGLSGCSLVAVQRPRSEVDDPRVADQCTTSVGAPVADTVLAGASLVGAYVAMVFAMIGAVDCAGSTGRCGSGNPAPALALAGTGVVFGSSAVYGYVTTHRCRRGMVLSGRCEGGDLGACRAVKPGWTPPPRPLAPPSAAPSRAPLNGE